MRFKKILHILVAITLVVLIVLYTAFFASNEQETTEEEKSQVIRVLAPYQAKLHQQILNTVAAEYSRDESHPQIEITYVPKENLEKVVKDATNGEGCDTFFECSGAAVPAMQMTDITRVRGKICIVSVHKKPHEVNLRDVNFKEQTVVGTRVYTKEEFGRAAELTKELEAELEKIVTHVVPLKESDKVFDMIADPECGTIKIVVDCENV